MRPLHPRSHELVTALAVLLVGVSCGAGCSRPGDNPRYVARNGTVESVNLQTGEITVQIESPRRGEAAHPLVCVATNDSELFINHRVSPLDGLRVGDEIELLGYADGLRAERFIVTRASVRRNGPTPRSPLEPSTEAKRNGAQAQD